MTITEQRQGSVIAPLLFNVYTDDHPIHPGTRSFVYADDLAVTTQSTDFAPQQHPGVSWRHTGPNVVIIKHISRRPKKESRNKKSIVRKLRNSKWEANPTTRRPSAALALCYSVAEYACPVWKRSTHANKLDATLNETFRIITGCVKPTNTNSLPVLAGIASSDIRSVLASRTGRTRQTTDERFNKIAIQGTPQMAVDKESIFS